MSDEERPLPQWAHKLQEFVLLSGMTQAEVARRAGLQRDSFGRYVLGKTRPPDRKIRAIADALGVKPSEIDESYAEFDGKTPPGFGKKLLEISPGPPNRPDLLHVEFSADMTVDEAAEVMNFAKRVQERQANESA